MTLHTWENSWEPGNLVCQLKGKPASESVISITSFFPPSPFPAVSILFLLFHVFFFSFFYHAPSLLLFVPISFSLILVFLPPPPLIWLSFLFSASFPSCWLSFSLLPQTHRDTHGHYTQRKKQNLIVGGAEGHFLSKTALLHCLLLRPDTWKILTRFVQGE